MTVPITELPRCEHVGCDHVYIVHDRDRGCIIVGCSCHEYHLTEPTIAKWVAEHQEVVTL